VNDDHTQQPSQATATAAPAEASEGSEPGASGPTTAAEDAPAGPREHAHRPVARAHSATRSASALTEAASGSDDGQKSTALFGAVGERAAAPLGATFTRGFPQAASADPLWLTAPFGSAGTVEVDLTLDEAGALVEVAYDHGAPGAALAEGIRRTLALIRARSFVAAGKVTRLQVSATVTADQVHDGLHGEVFALGGGFDGGEGSAFFALAVGRRVDIRVRTLR